MRTSARKFPGLEPIIGEENPCRFLANRLFVARDIFRCHVVFVQFRTVVEKAVVKFSERRRRDRRRLGEKISSRAAAEQNENQQFHQATVAAVCDRRTNCTSPLHKYKNISATNVLRADDFAQCGCDTANRP